MSDLKIALFKVDVTPPIGAQLAYSRNEQIGTPIFIRGILLDDGQARAVILASDFIYYWGEAWYAWRRAVAAVAKTSADRVFLHAIHQHDSIRVTPEWNDLCQLSGVEAVDADYCHDTLDKLTRAVGKAVAGNWQQISHLLTAERRVAGLAANRRLLNAQDECFAMRFSMCHDPQLQKLPVGVIDPMLRTIAFADSESKLVAALHFYATHPMGAYLRRMVSQDVPGVALDYAEQELENGPFNLYLTGCGGNVTFGKYNVADPEHALTLLGNRLGAAIVANLRHLEEQPMSAMTFATATFDYPLDPTITEAAMQTRVEQAPPGQPDRQAISRLLIARNWEQWRHCNLYRLSLGPDVHLLSLPGEMCVEYQLYAQSLIPERFLACAAYGNCTYHYIPTAAMFAEGGYEPRGSITTPAVEKRLKQALLEVLDELR